MLTSAWSVIPHDSVYRSVNDVFQNAKQMLSTHFPSALNFIVIDLSLMLSDAMLAKTLAAQSQTSCALSTFLGLMVVLGFNEV